MEKEQHKLQKEKLMSANTMKYVFWIFVCY